MARFTYPYEITKLFAIKEKEPNKVDTEISYAFAVQENFDIIKKYLNEIIDADNIVNNSITNIEIKTNTVTGGTDGNLGLNIITNVNIAPYTITGSELATDSITLANLGTSWTDWTPTYYGSEDMTYTGVSTIVAKYCVIDKICFFTISCMGTTGGTVSYGIDISLPIATAESANYVGGACRIHDDTSICGTYYSFSTTMLRIYRYDRANWGLGSNRRIYINGFYRID